MTRAATWLLLAVVAGAAAVLSFASLRDLAVLCGFSTSLAWLLPVVIDAGAAAGCVAWLRPDRGSVHAVRFARRLTVVLLVTSVAGNSVVHFLTAYRLAPPWWLVVAVSAVAPAVLGTVVHLTVNSLCSNHSVELSPSVDSDGDQSLSVIDTAPDAVSELIESGAGRRRLSRELNISEHAARQLLAERNGAGQ